LQAIWGDYATTAGMDALTADGKKDNHELADLCGARLVVANETRDGSRFDQQRVTLLTGRDSVKARQLYQVGFSYIPTYKIFVIGNHKPTLRSAGEEMRRRLHMIEFPESLPENERDTTLKDRLVAEYPAILQWAIDGFLKYQEVGLKKPAQVKAATDVYLANEDALAAWLDDNVNREPKARTLSSETYGNFRRWAEQSGEYCPSQKRFSGWLTDRGFEVKRTSQGSMIIGLELRQAASNEQGYYRGDDQ
jgi:P4 family phage/plasmid primase-like protien